MYMGTHGALGWFTFFIHEGSTHTLPIHLECKSGWETSFPVLPSVMYKSVPSIFGELSGKNPRAELEEPSGEARINTQERHKLHNPERQIYVSIIKASLCLLVLSLSLISRKKFSHWIPFLDAKSLYHPRTVTLRHNKALN